MLTILMMLQVAAMVAEAPKNNAIRAPAAAYEKCMLETGEKWASGTDAADVIARAVRAHCGPHEVELRRVAAIVPPVTAERLTPQKVQLLSETWVKFVISFADGLENKVVSQIVERRAKRR